MQQRSGLDEEVIVQYEERKVIMFEVIGWQYGTLWAKKAGRKNVSPETGKVYNLSHANYGYNKSSDVARGRQFFRLT